MDVLHLDLTDRKGAVTHIGARLYACVEFHQRYVECPNDSTRTPYDLRGSHGEASGMITVFLATRPPLGELRHLAAERDRAHRAYTAAATRWMEAIGRIDRRIRRCELTRLFRDMEQARAERDAAWSAWQLAFDIERGEHL